MSIQNIEDMHYDNKIQIAMDGNRSDNFWTSKLKLIFVIEAVFTYMNCNCHMMNPSVQIVLNFFELIFTMYCAILDQFMMMFHHTHICLI